MIMNSDNIIVNGVLVCVNYAAILDLTLEQNTKIQKEYADIRNQNNRLRDKLADMDLGLIASEKPDSIEKAINNGTINAGRCFEILSGAELTEKETNAENGKDFNKECPWLWPGNTTSKLQ